MPDHITRYVYLEQDIHHPTQTTTNNKSQTVIVPAGNKLVQLPGGHWYKWDEISQANCRGEKFEIYREPHFGMPIGITVSADLTSGPWTDRYRGWLEGNLTIAYESVLVNFTGPDMD